MKILSNLRLENIIEITKWVCKRFPVSVALILVWVVLILILLHWKFQESLETNLSKLTVSIVLTFFFSVWVYLSGESMKKMKTHKNVYQIIPLILWVLFYFVFSSDLDNFENFVFFFLTLAWILSYIFFAPYFNNKFLSKKKSSKLSFISDIKQPIYYSYFYNISVVFLMSFILWGLLFALGSIWISTVEALFDLGFDSKNTYWNWAVTSLALITPLFALSRIPSQKSFLKNDFTENKFFTFLIKFVAIPFIVIYFLILYAYTIKVLLNFWDWPKWEVSWMVIWFSIFGYITYIFSYIFESKNSFVKKFRSTFPYVVILQIFMLFYAIYLRINQYDITVNRYFVVVFWLWLLVISLYFIFSQKKKLAFIPAILTLFTIIISLGPWWVYSLPESRQHDRLENNLKKAWIINVQEELYWYTAAQEIVPLKKYSDVSQQLSKDIYWWIDYLCDFDSCSTIKNLFPKIYSELMKQDKIEWEKNRQQDIKRMQNTKNFTEYNTKENNTKRIEERKKEIYKWPNKWVIVNKITEKIKVKNYFPNYKNNIPPTLFFGVKWSHNTVYPILLEDYDFLTNVVWGEIWDLQEIEDDYIYVEINMETQEFFLKSWKKVLEVVSTKDIYKKLIELNKVQQQEESYNSVYKKKDLTFLLTWEKYDYKLFFQNIHIPNPQYKKKDSWEELWEWDILDIKYMTSSLRFSLNWFVLVKEK